LLESKENSEANQKSQNNEGRVRLALPFLSWRDYIDTMLDSCLKPGKIEILKMLDSQTKSAIDSDKLQV
jgi:hypothetical protein